MVCVYCGSRTEVTNSRLQRKTNRVWRRRHCQTCNAVFTSQEQVVYDGALAVKSGTSHIVPFNRDMLYLSIYDACRHRTEAISDASALTDTILSRLIPRAKNGLLVREDVVVTCAAILKRFDTAAAVHYTAFHHV